MSGFNHSQSCSRADCNLGRETGFRLVQRLTCMVESLKGLGTLRTGGVHDHWATLGDQAYD